MYWKQIGEYCWKCKYTSQDPDQDYLKIMRPVTNIAGEILSYGKACPWCLKIYSKYLKLFVFVGTCRNIEKSKCIKKYICGNQKICRSQDVIYPKKYHWNGTSIV